MGVPLKMPELLSVKPAGGVEVDHWYVPPPLIAVNVVEYGTPTSASGSGDCVVIAGAFTMVMEKVAWLALQGGEGLFATCTLNGKVPPAVGVPLMVVLTLKEVWRTRFVVVVAGLSESPAGGPELNHVVFTSEVTGFGENVVVAVRVAA